MTLYLFETMTAEQAANFNGAADQIVFTNPNTSAANISVSNSGGLNLLTLSAADGTALTFAAAQIKSASLAGNLTFTDGSNTQLAIGSSNGDILEFGNGVSASAKGVFYGFGGDDEIYTNNGASIVFGGAGGDTIYGGDGNDHLYGFGVTGDPSTDGNDYIDGGNGNDYIQGNAGDDTLLGGNGNDRIQGGQGDDSILGGNGNDVINGNKGNDTISGGDGNDIIRGGQGDDLIFGDAGNDVLMGDLGKDTLIGGTGIDVLTGGEGEDLFVFNSGDAAFSTTGALAYFADQITDFTIGEDKITLGGTIGLGTGNVLHAQAGITISSVEAALTYAQGLIDGGTSANKVAALQVGADTYLFYDDNGLSGGVAAINAMIKLDGVTAADFTATSLLEIS